jgi:DNA invertase Pin-like site-specific DNA recombinase
MLIGYARVSTTEQNLDLQTDALKRAGCDRTFTDKISGATSERPGLAHVFDILREGDTLVVWKLDRLGRSLQHLVQTVNDLHARGIGFKSLNESIDTSSAAGKLIFHVFAALAEFERDLIRDRTRAGIAAAKARGRTGGRKEKLTDDAKGAARELLKTRPLPEVASVLGVSESTLRRRVVNVKG